MFLPKILAWNCRGAGSQRALRHLIFVFQCYQPNILILLEPGIHSNFIVNILAKTCFTDFIVAEANGYSGGIWVIWNAHKLHVDPVSTDEQVVNAFIWVTNSPPWLLYLRISESQLYTTSVG